MSTLKFGNKVVFLNGNPIGLPSASADPAGVTGDMYYNNVSGKVRYYNGSIWQDLASGSVSLTGQPLNTSEILVGNGSNLSAAVDTSALGDVLATTAGGLAIKNAAVTNAKVATGIDAAKIADGSVSNTEYQYINSLTSNAQDQIDAKADAADVVLSVNGVLPVAGDVTLTTTDIPEGTNLYYTATQARADLIAATITNGDTTHAPSGDAVFDALALYIPLTQKGANNGVATLDGGGKIPVAQLPSSVMTYEGTWDASTNTPTLADGSGDAGMVYLVSVAGTQDLGSGNITFAIGDWVVYNGAEWEKSTNSNSVVSVNGQTGVVVLDSDDIAEGVTNLYFTDERAQDAVGAMVANSTKVSLTYVDGTPSLTADIIAGSLVNADINASAAIALTKLAAVTADSVLISNGSGFITASGVSATTLTYLDATSSIQTQLNGKANLALSNLASVAINTSLISDTDATDDLGSSSIAWNNLFAKGIRMGSGGNFLAKDYFDALTLTAGVGSTWTAIASLTFAHSAFKSAHFTYEILESTTGKVRSGRMVVASDGTLSDSPEWFSETAALGSANGLQLRAVVNGANIEVQYKETHATNASTMRVEAVKFRA